MDPAIPPEVSLFALAAAPAAAAAAWSAATAGLTTLSPTRRKALRDTLEGERRRAIDRYDDHRIAIETRWLVMRVAGIGVSAALFHQALSPAAIGFGLDGWRPLVAALAALFAYGLPAETLMAIAERGSERPGLFTLRFLWPLEALAAPFAWPIILIRRLVGRTAGPAQTFASRVTETEMELIVNEGERNGSLDHERSEMIRNVLDFGDLTAGELMVPRTRVIAYDMTTELAAVLAQVIEAEHSRYPIYRERIDNVVGILHVKDLLKLTREQRESVQLSDLIRRPVAFFPETQSASSVLRDMRAARHHMAIVVDEFGGMSGIVTLEDLLEEIVGDIQDEHDTEEEVIVDLGDGRVMVDASVPISDLSRYLNADLPEDGEYTSVGGFIVEHLGRVPATGSRFQTCGLSFVVRDANERHIAKVEVIRNDSSAAA